MIEQTHCLIAITDNLVSNINIKPHSDHMNSIIRAASRLAFGPTTRLSNKPIKVNQSIILKNWAHNMPLTYDFARERIMLILRLFDKIDPNKLTLDSHFVHDLGLDSLDHVEIIMALEDDFKFEIPDKDAEHLVRPSDILRYITDKEEAYKELQELQAASHHHGHEHGHEDHGHNHDNQSHGHHEHASPISSGQHSINQKREFSSWSVIAKRMMSSTEPPEGYVRLTSFEAEPPTEVKIEDIQSRVMKVLAKYDKIDSSKLQLSSHFVDDLGLDSLDHVEIMMELEDEFNLEIPDQEAEKLLRPAQVAKYIYHKEEARALQPEDRNL